MTHKSGCKHYFVGQIVILGRKAGLKKERESVTILEYWVENHGQRIFSGDLVNTTKFLVQYHYQMKYVIYSHVFMEAFKAYGKQW